MAGIDRCALCKTELKKIRYSVFQNEGPLCRCCYEELRKGLVNTPMVELFSQRIEEVADNE